jgi:hypothetical protein
MSDGPRAPNLDKRCSVTIPPNDPGFCDCHGDGLVHASTVRRSLTLALSFPLLANSPAAAAAHTVSISLCSHRRTLRHRWRV